MSLNNHRDIVIDASRLDRIEEKIDKLSDAMISLARAEERLISIETNNANQYERINKMSLKIDNLQSEVDKAKYTNRAISKLFWVILASISGTLAAVFIK